MLTNKGLRNVKITTDYTKHADGSVLIEFGDTKVICTAFVEEKVPIFQKNTGCGWISAEYAMLPGSTLKRKQRDSVRGKIDGRSQEIQRLIGRSLRNVVDFKKLGERTIWLDCDVIQADGGTRTASITGAFVAMALAANRLHENKQIKKFPITGFVAALSVGIVNDVIEQDLCYKLDSNAQVDMNVVMNDKKEFIEIQGTGEKTPFNYEQLQKMLELASEGIEKIIEKQKEALGEQITKKIKQQSQNNTKPAKITEKEILLATGNKNKIKEMSHILQDQGITIKTPSDYNLQDIEIEETGETFEENAIIKAKEYAKLTGKIAVADDSGLCVDALRQKPGVHSKRYSGQDATDEKNNEKLIHELRGYTSDQRTAKFVCTIAVAMPDGRTYTVTGECKGRIGFEPKGESGFGYDPLFIPDENNKESLTFAQIGEEEKNKISHRGKALKKLKNIFCEIFS